MIKTEAEMPRASFFFLNSRYFRFSMPLSGAVLDFGSQHRFHVPLVRVESPDVSLHMSVPISAHTGTTQTRNVGHGGLGSLMFFFFFGFPCHCDI